MTTNRAPILSNIHVGACSARQLRQPGRNDARGAPREHPAQVCKRGAGNYRYLHVDAHGEFRGDAPLQSRLALAADAANIVASLWEVDDDATAALMQAFYARRKAGVNKKEALRQAQVSLWPRYPQWQFWAAFCLTGQGL
jgi:CHAT domain-containing protein